jgi:hypothetical protein
MYRASNHGLEGGSIRDCLRKLEPFGGRNGFPTEIPPPAGENASVRNDATDAGEKIPAVARLTSILRGGRMRPPYIISVLGLVQELLAGRLSLGWRNSLLALRAILRKR